MGDATVRGMNVMSDPVDLESFDLILVNTSAGKDSALTAWYVTQLAEALGIKDRVVAVHATFAEEWEGTPELAARQCAALGIPLEIVTRGESLLAYVERRGMWPSSQQRYCTSDFKRAPVDKVITKRAPHLGHRKMRVLNVMGLRADESPARSKKNPVERDARRSNSRREVTTWLPIFRLSTAQVWHLIRQIGLEMHPAYAAGMPRLSCCFCIFAPKAALMKAGELNPELLAKYVAVEQKIGHSFRVDLKIADVAAALERGERATTISNWTM